MPTWRPPPYPAQTPQRGTRLASLGAQPSPSVRALGWFGHQAPSGNTYTFSITATAGSTIILLAATFNLFDSSSDPQSIVDTTHSTSFVNDFIVYDNTTANEWLSSWRLDNYAGGTSTITVTFIGPGTGGSAGMDLYAYAVTGLASSPYLSAVSASSHSALNSTSQLVTAAAAVEVNDVVFSLCETSQNNSGATTTAVGWTVDGYGQTPTTGAGGYGVAHSVAKSALTPSITWNTSAADQLWESIVAYRAVSSDTTPPSVVFAMAGR